MKNNLIINQIILASFLNYYHYHHLQCYLDPLVPNKKSIRRVNIHMKLTGRSFINELSEFVSNFEKMDEDYDFNLDHYEMIDRN